MFAVTSSSWNYLPFDMAKEARGIPCVASDVKQAWGADSTGHYESFYDIPVDFPIVPARRASMPSGSEYEMPQVSIACTEALV